jgi:hypothetical protein
MRVSELLNINSITLTNLKKILGNKLNDCIECVNGLLTPTTYLQDTSEGVTSIAITNGGTYNVKVVYSVQLPTIVYAGSIISITGISEVTNDQVYNLEVGRFIKIGTSATDAALSNYITRPVADNCTPANHHWVCTLSRQYYVSSNINNGYINFCMYGISDSVQVGQTMIVEQSYGHLDVVIFST